MADAATIGVLRDLAILVGIACFLGLLGYRMLRQWRPHIAWNQEGLVLSSSYGPPDLLLVAGLGIFFVASMHPAEGGQGAAPGIGAGSLVAGMAFNLTVCAGLLVYLLRVRGLNPSELFGLQRVHLRSLLVTVGAFAVVSLISVNVVSSFTVLWLKDVWPDLQPQETVKAFQESGGFMFRFLVIVAAVVIAPLSEEVLFRGVIYGVLKRYTDAPFAALSSSLMFAVIHMHVGSLMPLWILAVLFCIAYELTGCLLAPMLLHMIFNGTSILLMQLLPQQ